MNDEQVHVTVEGADGAITAFPMQHGIRPQKAEEGTRVGGPLRCDHICLLDAEHVDRGESHFYGYEVPSPRLAQYESETLGGVPAAAPEPDVIGGPGVWSSFREPVACPTCGSTDRGMVRDGCAVDPMAPDPWHGGETPS